VSKLFTAIGLMSGTSLDGIDVALVRTDGVNQVETGAAMTVPYTDGQRETLRSALAVAVTMTNRTDRFGGLAEVEQEITTWHKNAVEKFLSNYHLKYSNIDIIGFHGQTVIHRPERQLTVQLGLGENLANALQIPVAYDLRAADIAAGGQGAPLVPVYHRALASLIDQRPVVFVNIGGVANVTFVGGENELIAFDTGPGNALIDDWMKKHTGNARDEGGATALSGAVSESKVSEFLAHPFFAKTSPKSLDRNSFASISLEGLPLADGAATLVSVTARSIIESARHVPSQPKAWIICGGGRHNRAIMLALQSLAPGVVPAEFYGLNGDSMEAEAWAYLAVRSLQRLPLTFPGTTGIAHPSTGGLIAFPQK
jgi:anhydro-N-acetylmuramic acid kinase